MPEEPWRARRLGDDETGPEGGTIQPEVVEARADLIADDEPPKYWIAEIANSESVSPSTKAFFPFGEFEMTYEKLRPSGGRHVSACHSTTAAAGVVPPEPATRLLASGAGHLRVDAAKRSGLRATTSASLSVSGS